MRMEKEVLPLEGLSRAAFIQEVIDVLAVTNALRVAFPPKTLTDY
jgi:hypothetical protein